MRRILIVADDGERAALFEKAVRDVTAPGADVALVQRVTRVAAVLDAVDRFDPVAILVDLGAAANLDDLLSIVPKLRRPIAAFVDDADAAAVRKAMDAGIAELVVDGPTPKRVHAALEMAIGRHEAFSRLEAELEKARGALRDRALIERAKALLMERKRLSESEAYALLRRTAMSTNRRIADLARSIVEASALISDDTAGGPERE